MEHNLGWGLYLRNRFLHSQDSPIRDKLTEILIRFDADSVSSDMFKWLWMYATGQELNAENLRTMLDQSMLSNTIREMQGLTPIREIGLDQIEDLLGKSSL